MSDTESSIIGHAEFNARWRALSDAYYLTVRRAGGSWYTRSETQRREGAARRYRVGLRRLRAACRCTGCSYCGW